MKAAALKPKSTHRHSSAGKQTPAHDLERRRALGQFFTSAPVAQFIWDFLEVVHGRRFDAATRLIDPACGEGVFLRVAHERGALPGRNLCGADIDEKLKSGWRNDTFLREANLLVANGLLDNPAAGIQEGAFDLVMGNPPFSGKGLGDLLQLLQDTPDDLPHPEQDLFGVSYLKDEPGTSAKPLSPDERLELDRLVRALSQYSCWRLEPELEPESNEPSDNAPAELFEPAAFFDRRRPTASEYEQNARLIAHWPHNRALDTSRPEIRDTVRRLAGTAIEVMFTERFIRLAKPGGLIAVIVPESIVASDRLGAFRIWLLGRMDLLASVSLPYKVFTGVGANAKTSIIFARRLVQERPTGWYSIEEIEKLPEDSDPVFLAAPRLDAPGFSLESYLARVLADAREQRDIFWPDAK